MSDGATKHSIPKTTLDWLDRVPADRPVCMLIRHSVRDPLPPDDPGMDMPLTEEGVRLAEELGAKMTERIVAVHTSPVLRCVQTAEALTRGAGMELEIEKSRSLGAPGVYVVEPELAWKTFLALGPEGVIEHLVSSEESLPGLASPGDAALKLTREMRESAGERPGLHLFVTHDLLVVATVARLLGESIPRAEWPEFLDSAFSWRVSDGTEMAYRRWRGAIKGGTGA